MRLVTMEPERSTDLLLYSDSSFSGAGDPAADSKSQKRTRAARNLGAWKFVSKGAVAIMAVLPVLSQTTINLGTQVRNADFSSLAFTRPISVGSALPATCLVGQLFFNSSAAAGSNLYGCTAVNSWTMLSGAPSGGGSGSTTGNGIGSPSPTSLAFGNQTVSTTSPAQPIVLSNTGSGALTINSINLSGANAADFNIGNNCGTSVAIGASCTIAVTFTPSVTSAEAATVNITDNGTGSPHTIALTGTGIAAGVVVGPVITPAAPAVAVATPLTLTANSSVTWALAPGSAGTLASNGTSATYTPPASIPAPPNYAGCPLAPGDSIFNTRIDNLPVHSQSATWMTSFISPITFLVSWGTNIIDNSVPTTSMFFHYTTSYNGNFQILTGANRKREGGALTNDPGNDHHMISVNRQTCQFTETYQDGIPITDCPACNAASGYKYSATSYAMPTQGTTDAAGLPLAPLSVHLAEVKAGVIKHAMRFTLCTGCIYSGTILWPATSSNGSTVATAPPMGARFRLKSSIVATGISAVNVTAGGTGYTTSPTLTFTGCQTAPVATALISGGTVTSVALSTPGANCINPTVSFGGPGTGAVATLTAFSPTAQVFLTALQQYGMFLADNGLSGQIETDSDLNEDPIITAAMNEIANAKLGASAFEVVDESSLMMSSSSSQVNPNNGYVTPATYAVVTATDGQGNKTTVPIALQSVIIGVPYPKLSILAGMSGFQMQSWVTGSSNQNVTWALTSGPGSVTAGGLYTPPASVSVYTPVVLTATAAADSTVKTSVYLTVIPAGSNPANSIRVDVASSSTYTDTQGNQWLPDGLGWDVGSFSPQMDSYPASAWGTVVDPALYWSFFYTWGDDIRFGPIVVPNGNYKVGISVAREGCSGTFNESDIFDNGLIWGALAFQAQGVVNLHVDVAKATNSQCRVPVTGYIPATVTNNILLGSVQSTGGSNAHSVPMISTLAILPDSTAPYLTIDTNYANGMKSGALAQMYAVGWYMSNAVTWSVSGGGSIDQNGLYTAPASLTAATNVTITATSQSNSSISATAQLTIIP